MVIQQIFTESLPYIKYFSRQQEYKSNETWPILLRAHSESPKVKTLMGEAPLSDWVVMDGFLKEVIFELSLKNLIKRKIKVW